MKLLKFITEKWASFSIAKRFLIWDMIYFSKMQVFRKKIEILDNREKYPWALMRRTRIPHFIRIERWKRPRGEISEEPKTGENKILVLDAKYDDFSATDMYRK